MRTKDSIIIKQYANIQKSLSELEKELEHERFVKLAEEQKRKEEEERKKREREEKEKVENEKRIAEERIRRQQEANRLAEEAQKKEQAEQAERQRLESLSAERKENWLAFKQVLENNGIRYLYHFTDRRNIPSIKRHGGLLSWSYCEKHKIDIPNPGGGNLSRNLDEMRNLQDYVRLSFTTEHPMMYVAMKDGRISNPGHRPRHRRSHGCDDGGGQQPQYAGQPVPQRHFADHRHCQGNELRRRLAAAGTVQHRAGAVRVHHAHQCCAECGTEGRKPR